jgi:DNA-binding response OmpR family regulator
VPDPKAEVWALDMGAADYLNAPVSFEVLLARLDLALRRAQRAPVAAAPPQALAA